MDVHNFPADNLLMAKVVRIPSDGTRLYIGEWCAARDIRPAKVSREAPVNFGYLSGLISGKKTNPSRDMLEAIARVLGIKVSQLYTAPPSKKLLDEIEQYDPAVLADLIKKRQKSS